MKIIGYVDVPRDDERYEKTGEADRGAIVFSAIAVVMVLSSIGGVFLLGVM